MEKPREPQIPQAVGPRIRKARERARLSQAELGDRVKKYTDHPWTKQTVSQIERGRRDVTLIEALGLARVLGEPIVSFLSIRRAYFPSGVLLRAEDVQALVSGEAQDIKTLMEEEEALDQVEASMRSLFDRARKDPAVRRQVLGLFKEEE